MIPNKILHRLHAGDDGALTIKFNNSGSLLAVACSNNNFTFPIRIYDSESGSLRHQFDGHRSVVYDLQFSPNDKYLVSACADGTCKVWCLGGLAKDLDEDSDADDEDASNEEKKTGDSEDGEDNDDDDDDGNDDSSSKKLLSGSTKKSSASLALKGRPFLTATLQHNPPVYIYSACFQPPLHRSSGTADNTAPLVVTGSFDAAVRLWDPSTSSSLGLLGGKRFHDSHVNAMVFDGKTGRLYTGDGEGCIIIWRKQSQGMKGASGMDYVVMRKIDKMKELKGKAITSLVLDPSRPVGRGHILIMAHENTMRVFDLSTQRLTNVGYAGTDNHNSIVRAGYSACGKFIVAGTDVGTLLVWDSKTGLKVSSDLDSVKYAAPVNSVLWHPSQHVIAICAYGGTYPVLMYSADRDPKKSTVVKSLATLEGGGAMADVDLAGTLDSTTGLGLGSTTDGADPFEDEQRKAALDEKRKANRARYLELKEKAMKRKMEV